MAKSKANKSYSVGELISCESPLVHVLDNQEKGIKCDYCLNTNKSLKKCSNCLKVFYCNQKCQKGDWFWHKNECKVYIKNLNKCFGDFLLRILMRLWLRVDKSEQILHNTYRLFNGLNRSLNDLESHESEIIGDSNRMKQFNEFCDFFTDCVIHDLVYSNLKSGYGLYIRSCVLDHSCAPNASIVFDGTDLIIRAIKPIASREEVFVHYIPLDGNRRERKLQLQNQYYFHCNCSKCCTDEELSIDYRKFKELIRSFHSTISDEYTMAPFGSMPELLTLSDRIYGPIHPEMAAILMIAMQFQLMNPGSNLSSEELPAFIDRVGRVVELSFGSNHKFYKMYKMFASMKNMI